MFPVLAPPPAPPPAAAVATPASAVATDEPEANQQVASHGYRYVVTGNHLLTAREVRDALAGATTPRAAVGALKQAYEQHGYFLVALVGTERGKQVTIRVVQGRLTSIEGPSRLTRFFSGLKGNDRIRKHDVIRPSILAEAYAATNGKRPQLSFHPAKVPGGSVMKVGTAPLPGSHALGAGVTFGNFGNRYAGRYLTQAEASLRHDGITAQVTYTRALPGLASETHGAFFRATSANLSAITPAGIFALDASTTHYRLGKAFAPLFPEGRIEVFGATATQLLYADALRRWSIHEGFHRIHDATTVFSGAFTLSDRRFNLLDGGATFSQRFTGLAHHAAALNAAAGVKLGLAPTHWGFRSAPGAPQSHFQIYTTNVDLTQSLARGYSLKFSVAAQFSNDTLPSYEQWVLGGFGNLSAYLPGTLTGDRGYLARFTTQAPEWKAGPVRIQPSLFVEHGAARFSFIAPRAPVWRELTDVGVGLNVRVPIARTSAILAWAKPVTSRSVAQPQRDGQRAHLFFLLQGHF